MIASVVLLTLRGKQGLVVFYDSFRYDDGDKNKQSRPSCECRETLMKWSWRIGTLAGIGIYVHSTFLILLAWIGMVHYARGNDFLDFLHGLVFLATIFGTVVLHELGHALTARRFGIATRDITLLPIGGVARLERMPEDPRQELLVAIAGPAVNVVLAGFCLLCMGILGGFNDLGSAIGQGSREMELFANHPHDLTDLSNLSLIGTLFFARWFIINVVLVVFNLLPAFPMDGGRVLRAFLAMRMDYVRATQSAAAVGQMMALVFGFVGLFGGNPFLIFIALFVWMGATAEASMVQMKVALGGIPAQNAMVTEFQIVSPDETVSDVADHIIAGFQQDFPVVSDGELVGMLPRSDLLRALAEGKSSSAVREVMRTEFAQAAPSEMLEDVFNRLRSCHCHSMPIVENSHVVGVIDMENVGEFIAIRSALSAQRR